MLMGITAEKSKFKLQKAANFIHIYDKKNKGAHQ